MSEIEKNIARAFAAVKKDILEVKDQLLRIAERQEHIEATLEDSKKKDNAVSTSSLVQIKASAKKPKAKSKKKAVRKKK